MTTTTTQPATAPGAAHEAFDPVSLAVITSRMEGIVRRMTNTLFRTARSSVLNTARDFSCAIITGDDELLAVADSLPIHVMSGPDLIARYMRECHPQLAAGDAFLHNSPYHGNSHAGDHCIVIPVIDAQGAHHFTVLVKAHMADIGNSEPTTLWATCRDVYHEGALIFPCVKVQQDYRDVDDVLRMCRARIRVPDVWYGDYLGMVGAARIGERELLALGSELGWEHLRDYTLAWRDYSEQRMVEAIGQMPAGRVTASNAHDPIPGVEGDGLEEGIPLNVAVEIDPADGRIMVDFTDNVDCLPCGVNLTESTARTAAMIGVYNSLPFEVPTNAGAFRRLDIRLRENSIAGIPRHPASCSTATFAVADRLASAVQRAIGGLADGIGMAECGGECPASTAGISGVDPRRDGEPFVSLTILGLTGGGAHPKADGWVAGGEVGDGGTMQIDSVEVDELLYPIRVWANRIIPDTGGAGRRRGAPSAYVEYGPAGIELEAMWECDGYVHPAIGVRGGHPGATAQQFLRTAGGALEPLDPWGHVKLKPDETVIAMSTGGGGYGPPWERELERVLKDVREGWVTPAQAAEVYGVVVADGAVDEAATERRRAELAAAGAAPPPRVDADARLAELVERMDLLVRAGRGA